MWRSHNDQLASDSELKISTSNCMVRSDPLEDELGQALSIHPPGYLRDQALVVSIAPCTTNLFTRLSRTNGDDTRLGERTDTLPTAPEKPSVLDSTKNMDEPSKTSIGFTRAEVSGFVVKDDGISRPASRVDPAAADPDTSPPEPARRKTLREIDDLSSLDLKRLGVFVAGSAEDRGGPPGGPFARLRRLARAQLARALRLVFGISPPDRVNGLPGSRLIDPASPFAGAAEAVGAALLVYSLAAVPLELSFWQSPDPCERAPTLELSMLADAFFLLDIALAFLTGAVVDGRYCDRPPAVARAYLASPAGFWFDAVTSVPFAWIDWWALRDCPRPPERAGGGGGGDGPGWSDRLHAARALKPLKLLKMARILRVFARLRALLRRVGGAPAHERVALLLLSLLAFTHFFACAYWKVGRRGCGRGGRRHCLRVGGRAAAARPSTAARLLSPYRLACVPQAHAASTLIAPGCAVTGSESPIICQWENSRDCTGVTG